jgi:rifampicin phosphotransferase
VIVRSVPGGGVAHQRGESDHIQRLPDTVLADLARLGIGVTKHFGRRHDIEWAYEEDRIWLLQARPMTALPPPLIRLNAVQRRLGSVLRDYLPVHPYALDMNTWVPLWSCGPDGRSHREVQVRRPF